MLTADIIKTALEILFAAALLVGVLNREKLIAFERKIVLLRRMIGAIVRASLKAMRIAVEVAFMAVEGGAEK